MRRVRLGSTDLEVSAIAYGGMSLTPERARQGARAVATAFELGVNFFDTADIYSRGEAETLLGQALRDAGVEDNSLVVFTSDNGGYLTYEGGYHNISSNGPLRGQKTELYEGGHRVPAIARWPGRIQPGVSDETTATFDLFPTLMELADAPTDGLDLDGRSLTGLLFEGTPVARRDLFWRMGEKKAMRRGEWKVVRLGDSAPELYDLGADIGERNDLAADEPERLAGMLEDFAAWEADVDAR